MFHSLPGWSFKSPSHKHKVLAVAELAEGLESSVAEVTHSNSGRELEEGRNYSLPSIIPFFSSSILLLAALSLRQLKASLFCFRRAAPTNNPPLSVVVSLFSGILLFRNDVWALVLV